jgi:epoxyqueuosine reductase
VPERRRRVTDPQEPPAGEPADDLRRRREAIRATGLELGFLQVGFAPAARPSHADVFLEWLREGHHGEMAWLGREDSVRRRLAPTEALPGCRSLIIASLGYAPGGGGRALGDAPPVPEATTETPLRAVVARYAAGRDYHGIFETRLTKLEEAIRSAFPAARTRQYVDYGPVLERDHAQRAGLGWIGKNTMLIHPHLGSWTLLGEILTTARIPPDGPFEPDHCGTCERCIEACPTNAITHPRRLDARLCISYLTIELRGPIPEALRPAIGSRVFGCDICQEACPWNDGAPSVEPVAFATGRPAVPSTMISWTEELLDLSPDEFRFRYGDTPFARPGREGMLRNLCVGLGNTGEAAVLPTLMRCLDEPSGLVREHAAWGIGRLAELRDGRRGPPTTPR